MKTPNDILRMRLAHQLMSIHSCKTVYDVVKWMGAIQAQDYYGSLWAIGLRMDGATAADVEKAIANREIVRSWPMRGTLHYTAPEDLRWMLKLLAPRVVKRAASMYVQSGLDDKILKKASRVVTSALDKNPVITRGAIYDVLERAKISTADYRGLRILGWMALQGTICFAARIGKQPSFALMDYWVAPAQEKNKDEALSEVASQYFKSHGPATIQDFCWWTGLTLTEAKRAIDIVRDQLSTIRAGEDYYVSGNVKIPGLNKGTMLIPAYDEYTVGYKDRSLLSANGDLKNPFEVLSPGILVNGILAGSWKKAKGEGSNIETRILPRFQGKIDRELAKSVKAYKKFCGA